MVLGRERIRAAGCHRGQQTAPVQVGDASTWVGLNAGFDTVCAVRADGSLWCWGNNTVGQLADGTTTHRYAPVRIGDDTARPPRGRRRSR